MQAVTTQTLPEAVECQDKLGFDRNTRLKQWNVKINWDLT